MIHRLYVDGYKSLTGMEVELRPLSVLFGPNAVGKSNFLDAIQLLSRMVNAQTLKQAFESPHRGTPLEAFTFGPDGIAGHLQKESVSFRMEVDVELSDHTIATVEKLIADMRGGINGESAPGNHIKEKLLRYSLEVEILPRSGILRVCNESLSALKANGEAKESRNPFLEKLNGKLYLRMEGQSHPTYHEVGLDHTLVSRPHYPPHYPHLIAFRQELAGWFCFYFEPRERMRASNPVKEVRHIGMMGEELGSFLNTLQVLEPRQFKAVERAISTLIPRIEGISVETNKLGQVELNVIEDGMRMPARLVSEGTLRMLGMLAMGGAKDPPTLVAFEEPENGIHPRRLELIARFLESKTSAGRTQFIVTTHSPRLPDLIPYEALFTCSRNGRQTEIRPLRVGDELFRKTAVQDGLSDMAEDQTKVSEQILRGTSMVELVMILEDSAHEALLRPLVERLALQENVPLRLRIRSVRGGYGRVLDHLGGLERECKQGGTARPDGVLVAVDANCKGFVERRNAVMARAGTLVDRVIPAIPDPHVERWLLLDSLAFKAVVGRGCQAPDGKCEKDRYKRLLMQAVRDAGVEPLLGGIEHAREIAGEMDVKKVAAMDASFGHFVEAMRAWLKRMKPG